MAARKPGKVAAPVKQKLRKKHGPKRHMFHDWDKCARIDFGHAGILTKYDNYESFAQSCGARGVKANIHDLWDEFSKLPNRESKDAYFSTIKERSLSIVQDVEAKKKKAKRQK